MPRKRRSGKGRKRKSVNFLNFMFTFESLVEDDEKMPELLEDIAVAGDESDDDMNTQISKSDICINDLSVNFGITFDQSIYLEMLFENSRPTFSLLFRFPA